MRTNLIIPTWQDSSYHNIISLVSSNKNVVLNHNSRGVARNEHLGGLGCNRNILNIIFKSIGYKIINFHISSYTWTCWEFNRNSKHVRNKKIEKKKNAKRKTITRIRQYLRGSVICLRPQSCRDFTIIKENYNVRLQCFLKNASIVFRLLIILLDLRIWLKN